MVATLRTPLTYLVGILATGLAATAVIVTSLLMPTSPLIDRIVRGWALRRLHMVPVDRFAGRAVYEEVEQNAAATIARGKSIIVYPEGTRTTTGDLLRFKNGAFFIAVRSGLPILPTAIEGSFQAWLPGARIIRGGPVTVAIGAPLSTQNLTVADAPRLRDQTRATIE